MKRKQRAAPKAPATPSLTPAQQAVVDHGDGPLLAGAVAGAGKSTTLVERIHRLLEAGAHAEDICLVAFNSAAAADLNAKLGRRLGRRGKVEIARTLHSLALLVLRSRVDGRTELDAKQSNWKSLIIDAFNASDLPRESRNMAVMQALGTRVYNDMIECHPENPDLLAAALMVKRNAKAAAIDTRILAQVFCEAEKMRLDGKLIGKSATFDQSLYDAVHLLESSDMIRRSWQSAYAHVIVDEAQDLCEAQWRLVEMLSEGHRNLVVVGDPAQTLYRFRGARPERLLAFEQRWGAKTILMRENFRSGQSILRAANKALVDLPLTARLDMDIAPTKSADGVTRTLFAATPSDEAQSLFERAEWLHKQGMAWRDMAILVRLNAQTTPIEFGAFHRRIPVKIVSGASFFDGRIAKTLLSYLRLIAGKAKREDLLLAVSTPPRRLGKRYVDSVEARATAAVGDWVEWASTGAQTSHAAASFLSLMGTLQLMEQSGSKPYQILDRLITLTGRSNWSQEETESGGSETVNVDLDRFLELCEEFHSVEEMLETIESVRAHKSRADGDAMTISTVHQAKGLEWPVVFVPGANAQHWPVPWGDHDDELRCWYVALTRARDRLYVLSHSRGEGLRAKEAKPSSFLAHIAASETDPPLASKNPEGKAGTQMRLV